MNFVGLVVMAFVDSALPKSKEHYPYNFIGWDPSPAA